jgi:HPt (histidine-containing phosphotransfer) domain-containing protein
MNEDTFSHGSSTFEREELLARCIGRVDLLERVLNTFQHRFGEDLAQLENDLRSANVEDLARVAHRMKGASANIAAPRLSSLASVIERLARQRRLAEISPHIHEIRKEWLRFRHKAFGNGSKVNGKNDIGTTNG